MSVLILILCYLLIFPVSHASAQTLLSPSYQIRFGNFNMTSGEKDSASYSLTDTVGQTAAGLFSGTGYAILAGFQYLYTLYDFTFTISDLTVDFVSLIPDTFSNSSHDLIVSTPRQGYTVTAYETAPLTKGTVTIADTACDSGPCTETTAEVWGSATNHGFGYNMSGHDIPATFASSSHFRPFPDFSLAETPAVVMQSSAAGVLRTATVTYRLSVGSTQAAGDYTTNIIYIATPTY